MLDELELMVGKELAKLNCLKGPDKSQMKSQPAQPYKESINLVIQIGNAKNKEEKIKKSIMTEECSFRPMLSRKSLMIAEKLGDARERLTKNRSVTPEPKSQSQSQTRKRTASGVAPRWEQLYTLNQFYKTKKEALKVQIELEKSKESETTFRPDLSKSQTRYCDFSMPFDQRNRYWEAKKQEKISQVEQELKNENLQNCTFRPVVNKKVDQKKVKVSEFNKKGLITYFERVQAANKKKEEPVKQSKWKPGYTIPKEFKLSHNNKQI